MWEVEFVMRWFEFGNYSTRFAIPALPRIKVPRSSQPSLHGDVPRYTDDSHTISMLPVIPSPHLLRTLLWNYSATSRLSRMTKYNRPLTQDTNQPLRKSTTHCSV